MKEKAALTADVGNGAELLPSARSIAHRYRKRAQPTRDREIWAGVRSVDSEGRLAKPVTAVRNDAEVTRQCCGYSSWANASGVSSKCEASVAMAV